MILKPAPDWRYSLRHLLAAKAANLTHVFICAMVDYGNVIYAGCRSLFNQLQCVSNTTVWLVAGIPKHGHLFHYTWNKLHWLAMRRRVELHIFMPMHSCLVGCAPF